MASTDPDKTPDFFGGIVSDQGTPSDLSGGSNGGLHIPISNDNGFYGYNEEKHLLHVSPPVHPLALASNEIIDADGREVNRPTQRIDQLRWWESRVQVRACHDLSYFGHRTKHFDHNKFPLPEGLGRVETRG